MLLGPTDPLPPVDTRRILITGGLRSGQEHATGDNRHRPRPAERRD